jgi:hypothetical protein
MPDRAGRVSDFGVEGAPGAFSGLSWDSSPFALSEVEMQPQRMAFDCAQAERRF